MRQAYRDAAHGTRLAAAWRMIFALLIFATAGTAQALSEEAYSYEEEEACASDAFRLCSDLIPDISRITACMQAKHDQLSPPCAKMFAPGRDRHLNEPGATPSHDPSLPSRDNPK